MKRTDFSFNLPEELIAQYPSDKRGESRLLVYHKTTGAIEHCTISDIVEKLPQGALLVVNNSKVRKARIYGESETGGSIEILLLREEQSQVWQALMGKAKKQRIGKKIILPNGVTGTITGQDGEFRQLTLDTAIDDGYLETHGHVPLPPYVKRDDTDEDWTRYQTVYAKEYGSVAAPTAGLHFTPELLQKIKDRGIQICSVTLHVGAGTFLPIRVDNIEEHSMHREFFTVPQETSEAIAKAKAEGRPVIALGTTTVRTLESAAQEKGKVTAGTGSTTLYITPGYQFQVVEQMITNFHTPESSLLVMVSAFAGYDEIQRIYQEAIEQRYRFYSFGDAMFMTE